jgi:hypothetical protein
MSFQIRGSAHCKKLLGFSIIASSLALWCVWRASAESLDKFQFPEGYDAVQAAPDSHKIIFENSIVRVLEVPIPPVGKPEPMHHHRWASVMLHWDTGGKSPHIRYRRPDGTVRDIPSKELPVHPGRWVVAWMNPEPMHSIETVDSGSGQEPPYVRVEIKIAP